MKRPKVHPKLTDALNVDGPWGKRSTRRGRSLGRGFVARTALLAAATFFVVFGVATKFSGNTPEPILNRVTSPQSVSAPTQVATVIGRAVVVDGDTIEIAGERIRINGIDAPETAQLCQDPYGKAYRCGSESARALDKLLAASRPTECHFFERDQYGRFVGDCYRADGQNVAKLLVSGGHALDWPKHSNGAYADVQLNAQVQKLGVWRGKFMEPWEWRAEQRRMTIDETQRPVGMLSSGVVTDAGCRIKGNISSKGERIYHVPGQEYYDRTRISTSKGERWFCSEAEAQSAGWRRSRR